MTLTLDPRLPLLWRTPDSLQLGVDGPAAVLPTVSIAHERMLAALAVGVTRPGLELIGTESGLGEQDVATFLRLIRPALLEQRAPVGASVAISGSGPTVDRLAWRLREAGLDPHPIGERPDDATALSSEPGRLAVVVGHYVLDPGFRGLWLRRDVPHLPIVYGDRTVRIGPFVEPGSGPCLYCLERHRADADPAWPALAAQLLGRRSSAETPFVASEAATIATRLLLARASGPASPGPASPAATGIVLDVETGARSTEGWVRHPECACAGLPELAAASEPAEAAVVSGRARPGIAMRSSRPDAARSMPTRTGEAVSVPA
jgi:bacteriocin biosynthesis cyclodehydratase domain-containing protein